MATPALSNSEMTTWKMFSSWFLSSLILLNGCSKDSESASAGLDSGAGVREEILKDRFGKSITLPKAIPGKGSSPEQRLHGHWIWLSIAFTDESGQKLVNGPWPMEEAHHLYIDSRSGKKKMIEVYDNGSIEEYYFSVSSQNAKSGVIKIERWYVKDDDKPVQQRGAAKREYTLKSDGTLTLERILMGTPQTETLRRIGDETQF